MADRHIRSNEIQSCGHIRMDHAASFCHTPQMTCLTINFKLYCHLLLHGIGGHDRCGCRIIAGLTETIHQLLHMVCKRSRRHWKSDHSCRCNHHLILLNAQSICCQPGCLGCHLLSVCIAGIGILGIYKNRMGHSVSGLQMLLRHKDRRTFDLILCIDSRCLARLLTVYHAKIIFLLVRIQSTVETVRLKSLRSANTAVNIFIAFKLCHIHKSSPFCNPAKTFNFAYLQANMLLVGV